MKKMVILVSFLLVGCGVEATSTPPDPPPPEPTRADAGSVCILPSTGGFGSACNGYTPDLAAWTWLETSPQGEVVHRCNEVACVSGATCVVQSDVSGKDNGGELLMGTCQ